MNVTSAAMMIHQISPQQSGRLVISSTVPFSFRLSSSVSDMPLYLMMGDLMQSLLEIRINRASGVVMGVTLTLFEHSLTPGLPLPFFKASRQEGWIKFDVDEWQSDRRDEAAEFLLFRSHSAYSVIFHDLEPEKLIVGTRVGFFVAANRLCGIEFFDLTGAELDILNDLWSRSDPAF